MTGAELSAVLVGVLLVAAMAAIVIGVRRRGGRAAASVTHPELVDAEVVSGLVTEVRKWQAEATYWKGQAERLARELDERNGDIEG